MLLYTYLRLRNDLKFRGLGNVPPGPVILACNHASFMDPVLVSIAFPHPGRRVRWIAWDALFRIPLLGFLIRKLGAFPVAVDGADRSALDTALGLLRAGGLVGVFPEGGRTPTGEFQQAKRGFAVLASRSRASVVPVAIRGSYRAWPMHELLPGPGKVRVYFLPPLRCESRPLDRTRQESLCREFGRIQKEWGEKGY
jgi:1-acyl-sn-glycerol-3-phosphate acyltransferase